MWKWAMTHQMIKEQAALKKKFLSEINKILNHPKTQKLELSAYPKVLDYISEKFPGVDVLTVDARIISHEATKGTELHYAGGFFVESQNLLVVKDQIKKYTRGKYNKLMTSYYGTPEFEDILLHELLHVVSAKVQRSSRLHSHMEEEFVYANCIDFYKRKGMTDASIISDNFFPFLANDVWKNSSDIKYVLKGLASLDELAAMTKRARDKFINANAELLVNRVADRATAKGWQMFEVYNKYGHTFTSVNNQPNKRSRFSVLDFSTTEEI